MKRLLVIILIATFCIPFSVSAEESDKTEGKKGEYEYENWEQYDTRWGTEPLGDSTLAKSGCLITCLSTLMVHAQVVPNNPAEFNPAVYTRYLFSSGLMTTASYNWTGSSVYTNGQFKAIEIQKVIPTETTNDELFNLLYEQYSKGYFLICKVNGGSDAPHSTKQHYVAILSMNKNTKEIYINDPAHSDVLSLYKWNTKGTTTPVIENVITTDATVPVETEPSIITSVVSYTSFESRTSKANEVVSGGISGFDLERQREYLLTSDWFDAINSEKDLGVSTHTVCLNSLMNDTYRLGTYGTNIREGVTDSYRLKLVVVIFSMLLLFIVVLYILITKINIKNRRSIK